MTTANYCAFYVAEPFNQSALSAHATKDFVYYNLLRSWKGSESNFPFNDSHATTYSVRDGSDWERTLKPRLHERLRNSKNIILFLSSRTVNSSALAEEIDYGINTLGLPILVVYPDYESKESILYNGSLKQEIRNLWGKLPIFKNSMDKIPTLHIPMSKILIKNALSDTDFMLKTKIKPSTYIFPLKA